MTTNAQQPEPIRKGLLPTTPPAEWEFSSAFATGPDAEPGLLLIPGDAGPVVVRRRVTYGDWEPVRPDRWAEEPPSDVAAVSVPASAPTDRAAEFELRGTAEIRAAAFEEAAEKLAGLDPAKAALAGESAWKTAAGVVRHMAVQERRMANGEQPASGSGRVADETQAEPEAPWATDGARIGRTLIWSWADIGKGEFASGYRAAQEQARAFLTGPLLGAPEAQPPVVVSQPDGEACTCAAAGPAFAPAGHYADCPQSAAHGTPL
ncbi:hypothetical protein [Streptomyces aureus]|uniref:hypothetical protein n=1 Tax=Streptomyces aureus TaxID=193461 RepID=UPI00368A0769